MVFIRLITLVFSLALFSLAPAWAAGAKSPEALAMVLASAYRSGDVAGIVAMHHFVATQSASVAEQRATARHDWRRLVQQYQLSGYRVSMLSASDRRLDHHGLKPVRTLVINLVERHGAEKYSAKHLVANISGSYFFISR